MLLPDQPSLNSLLLVMALRSPFCSFHAPLQKPRKSFSGVGVGTAVEACSFLKEADRATERAFERDCRVAPGAADPSGGTPPGRESIVSRRSGLRRDVSELRGMDWLSSIYLSPSERCVSMEFGGLAGSRASHRGGGLNGTGALVGELVELLRARSLDLDPRSCEPDWER